MEVPGIFGGGCGNCTAQGVQSHCSARDPEEEEEVEEGGEQHDAVKKAIQKAMTHIGYSWLRELLLSYNNNTVLHTNTHRGPAANTSVPQR